MPPPRDSTLPNPVSHPSDYWTDPVYNDTYPAISPLSANLAGKTVFISGASKGIGRAIALSFARAGASQIAIGSRSSQITLAQELSAAAEKAGRPPPKVLPIAFDVTSKESIASGAHEIEKTFGRCDIIVNNAGILGPSAPIADTDPDDWWDTWTVNLRGPYLVTRALLPLMLKGGDKQIVNVSSVGAHSVSPGLSAYQPTKLALLRFTEFVQAEYGPQGVCAFCVHPGNVATEILSGIGGVPKSLEHIFVETPDLAADTIVFLTKEKRVWLGGRYVNVTWDMSQLMEKEEEIVKGDKLKVRLVW